MDTFTFMEMNNKHYCFISFYQHDDSIGKSHANWTNYYQIDNETFRGIDIDIVKGANNDENM